MICTMLIVPGAKIMTYSFEGGLMEENKVVIVIWELFDVVEELSSECLHFNAGAESYEEE